MTKPAGNTAAEGQHVTNHGDAADFAMLVRTTAAATAACLRDTLPALSRDWWAARVVNVLSEHQQRTIRERRVQTLDQLDLAALLRILDRNWSEIAHAQDWPREGLSWVKELQHVRNRWAHGAAAPPAADLYRDADTASRLLRLIGADPDAIGSIDEIRTRALQAMSAQEGPEPAAHKAASLPSRRAPAKARSARGKTLEIGRVNRNGQELIRATDMPGNHVNQKLYVMRCTVAGCGHEYGANGADVWLRKCPRCQGGQPGLSLA